jgi:hypothetical protein
VCVHTLLHASRGGGGVDASGGCGARVAAREVCAVVAEVCAVVLAVHPAVLAVLVPRVLVCVCSHARLWLPWLSHASSGRRMLTYADVCSSLLPHASSPSRAPRASARAAGGAADAAVMGNGSDAARGRGGFPSILLPRLLVGRE